MSVPQTIRLIAWLIGCIFFIQLWTIAGRLISSQSDLATAGGAVLYVVLLTTGAVAAFYWVERINDLLKEKTKEETSDEKKPSDPGSGPRAA